MAFPIKPKHHLQHAQRPKSNLQFPIAYWSRNANQNTASESVHKERTNLRSHGRIELDGEQIMEKIIKREQRPGEFHRIMPTPHFPNPLCDLLRVGDRNDLTLPISKKPPKLLRRHHGTTLCVNCESLLHVCRWLHRAPQKPPREAETVFVIPHPPQIFRYSPISPFLKVDSRLSLYSFARNALRLADWGTVENVEGGLYKEGILNTWGLLSVL